jgi:hypothetical protein
VSAPQIWGKPAGNTCADLEHGLARRISNLNAAKIETPYVLLRSFKIGLEFPVLLELVSLSRESLVLSGGNIDSMAKGKSGSESVVAEAGLITSSHLQISGPPDV